MIKIIDKSEPVTVFFDKLSRKTDKCHIVLIGIGEQYYDLGDNIDDMLFTNANSDFYMVNIDLKDIPDGEYKWIINDYERGLMRIGSLTNHAIQPDFDVDDVIQSKTYIEFE